MKRPILFVTGTDTGVGKTVLAGLLTAYGRERGLAVAALKPICSGGRSDARQLRAASDGILSLSEVNPWSFRAPLAPRLAARREGRPLLLRDVLAHIRTAQSRFRALIIEGAGGLRSPLGEDFDARDLIVRLRAIPIVVCPNRLGALNQCLLVLDSLPPAVARKARVVLVEPVKPDLASWSNPTLLGEMIGRRRVHELPRRRPARNRRRALADPELRRALERISGSVGF